MADKDALSWVFIAGFAAIIYYLWQQSQPVGYAESSDMNDFAQPFVSPGSLVTSAEGKAFIVQQEGWRRTPYRDIYGNLTIGVGHLIVPGDGFDANTVLTDGQVGQLFDVDRAERENQVKAVVTVPITQSMFDALVDYVFNRGIGTLMRHTTILQKLNGGDYRGAATEIGQGPLPDRRYAEKQMFLT